MSAAFSKKTDSEPSEPRVTKGQASRDTILRTAATLATTRGLYGLSIGDLAAAVGMSKSGLHAHFKSKKRQRGGVAKCKVPIHKLRMQSDLQSWGTRIRTWIPLFRVTST